MNRAIILPGIILILLLAAVPAQAETRIMILLDASGSMAAPGSSGSGSTKLSETAAAITSMLQQLPAAIAIGLRVIGGTPSSDCYTSFLYLSPTTGMRSIFQDQVATIIPSGSRALYQGIEDGMSDLTGSQSGLGVLLVITDGGDACDRDLGILVSSFEYMRNRPRIVIYGLDLTNEDRDKIGEFAGAVDGRLVTLQSVNALTDALVSFSNEFLSNTRVHLQNSSGVGVQGDITIINVATGTVVAESLDKTDYNTTLPPGTYKVRARYLGQEIQSDQFTVVASGSGGQDISLTFAENLQTFILSLKDLYDNAVRARVTFINSLGERVLSTGIYATHRVELPPDTYSLEVRFSDRTEMVYGVIIGPGQPSTREIQLSIELAVLEAEVTNYDGEPINADIKIMDVDGTVVDEAPYTSYLYSHLPPGQYEVVAEANGVEGSQTVNLYEGEQMQVGIELDLPLGDLFVKLRTESGNEVWGWVTVYDQDGNKLKRFDPESAESPDWNITGLVIGTYRVEAEADDIVRVVTDVRVMTNQETEITITFPDDAG